MVKCSIRRVRSFFALGFGIEKFNLYEIGPSWHTKIYFGPWVILFNPKHIIPVECADVTPQKDGAACPYCQWLVRRIQDDGSVKMEHDYKCRLNPLNNTDKG
jgi:hypothetical protein